MLFWLRGKVFIWQQIHVQSLYPPLFTWFHLTLVVLLLLLLNSNYTRNRPKITGRQISILLFGTLFSKEQLFPLLNMKPLSFIFFISIIILFPYKIKGEVCHSWKAGKIFTEYEKQDYKSSELTDHSLPMYVLYVRGSYVRCFL